MAKGVVAVQGPEGITISVSVALPLQVSFGTAERCATVSSLRKHSPWAGTGNVI